MKTHNILLPALILSAAVSIPVQAGGGHHGNGGSQVSSAPAPVHARGGASSFRSGSAGIRYGGGRMISSSQRFSSVRSSSLNQRRFASGTLSRPRLDGGPRFEGNRARNLGAVQRHQGNRAGSIGNANHALGARNNHVFARHSANSHPNWNRHHDHWWHGHRCRFVNNSWIIFDLGFSPWWGYPYDYYAYDYYYPYPYNYGYGYGYNDDSDVYDGVEPNNDEGKDSGYYYDSSNQGTDSTMAVAQEQLAKHGYYRGEIDGIFGPETQRAIMRYQRDKGLRVTGSLTTETLRSLGSSRIAGD